MKRFSLVAALTILWSPSASHAEPRFRPETLDANVSIGYGVAIEDIDGDGKLDILLADKKQFVWYQNPDWKRHIIAENLTVRDNVCIAARDIDGDGKVEVAVGAEWNPGDTVNSGSVHYLVAPTDRTQKWTPVKLHHEPVVHRMRWVRIEDSKDGPQYVLVVAPLHGRGNRNGAGVGVRLLAYVPPQDPARDEWKTVLLDDSLHVTHNFDRGQWDAAGQETKSEEIAYSGREGAMMIRRTSGQWTKMPLTGIQGGGEIRMGKSRKAGRFLATVEPFHGDKLVVYQYSSSEPSEQPNRRVLANDLSQGHAVATGDLLNLGSDQIVVGWRARNANGEFGVRIYVATTDNLDADGPATEWENFWVDRNGMACEDLRVRDLDGDGDLDIVAAGRATNNLKIYWNQLIE